MRDVPAPPFVGRESQLELLRQAVIAPPTVVVIEGEAGVGKSRLVHEAISTAAIRDRRILVGHCHRVRQPFPLGPVIDALRGLRGNAEPPNPRPLSPLAGVLRRLLPELGDWLPQRPEPLDDQSERYRVFRALRELLAALGPTVCVLEDLDAADSETVEFLSFLFCEPPGELAVVLTCRDEGFEGLASALAVASRPRGENGALLKGRLKLLPLAFCDARKLVCALLDVDRISEGLASSVQRLTGGFPLAIEEVVRLPGEPGDPRVLERRLEEGDPDQIDVPLVLAHPILARTAALSDDAKLLVAAAAVLGQAGAQELLAEVAELPPRRAANALSEAISAAVIRADGDGRYGFPHALAARAVYRRIPPPHRQLLHLRAAHALESASAADSLALVGHHFKQAGQEVPATRYLELAAEAATAAGDDRSASRLLEEALSAPCLLPADQVRISLKIGDAALYSVRPQFAIRLLERTLESEGIPAGARGELRFSLSRLLCHVGETSRGRREMTKAVEELRRRPDLAARAMVNLALPGLSDGSFDEQRDWLERAVQLAANQDDPVARTAVLAQRANILLRVGDPAGWQAVRDIPARDGSLGERLQLLRGYYNLSMAALGLGYYRRAQAFLNVADQVQDVLGHESWRFWLATARCFVDAATGRWEGLELRLRELIEDAVETSAVNVDNQILLGTLLVRSGETEEGARILQSALESSSPAQSLTILGNLARLYLAGGDFRAARRVASRGIDIVARKGIWVWATDVAPAAVESMVRCGDGSAARDLVIRFTAGLRGRDAPAARAAIASCQGALAEAEGRYDAAARSFGRAQRIWSELPDPYQTALARERRGLALLARDDELGGTLLFGAVEICRQLGANRDAARIRAELRAQGLPYPSRGGGRRSYGDELSPREAEVARLAGAGKTNREIGEALFISQHTVARHIASVLRKLGAGSRRELATSSWGGDEAASRPAVEGDPAA